MPKHDVVKQPMHYVGNGKIECKDAMSSMLHGWCYGTIDHETAYWLTCAFKYIWRAPIKNGIEDIEKAQECLWNAHIAMSNMLEEKQARNNIEKLEQEVFAFNKAKKVWEETSREEYEDYCERAGY